MIKKETKELLQDYMSFTLALVLLTILLPLMEIVVPIELLTNFD